MTTKQPDLISREKAIEENTEIINAIAKTTALSQKQVKGLFVILNSYDDILRVYNTAMRNHLDIFRFAVEYSNFNQIQSEGNNE
jgi:hypothetical protein